MGNYASNGQQYAARADLYKVLAAAALTHPSTGTDAQDAQLLRASQFADGYLRQQFKLPLLTWGADLVQAVCDIAAYRLICLRGFNPDKDGLYADNNAAAVRWLELVSKDRVSPDVVDSTSGAEPGKQADPVAPLAYSPSPINSTGLRTRGTSRR